MVGFLWRAGGSGVAEEGFEAVVHVLLDVAVEEGEAGLVGGEVYGGAAVVGDDDGVLDDAGGFFAVDVDEFELVAVEVEGVGVVGAVAEDEAVACAWFEDELIRVRVGFAVDEPGVEFAGASGEFFEGHVDGLVGGTCGLSDSGGAEECVVPRVFGGGDPLGLAVLVLVLDDEAEAGAADLFVGGSEDPDAGVVHLDDGVDALAGAEEDGFDGLGGGDGVAIEGDDLKLVAGEGDAAVLDGAGVEEVEEDALAGFDAEGFAGAEGFVVNGVGHGADFEAIGGGVEGGGLLGLGAVAGVVVIVLHVGHEEGLPVAEGEEVLLIVAAGIGGGVDVDEAELAGVGTFVEVGVGHGVGVVPAGAEGFGRELVAAVAAGWDEGGAFFFDSVDVGGDQHAVPVDQLGGVGVVDDVDGEGPALFHPQDWPGGCSVVADGGEDAVGGELDGDGLDAQGEVGFGGGGGLRCGGGHLHLGEGRSGGEEAGGSGLG